MAYRAVGTRVYWESTLKPVKRFWIREVEGRIHEDEWIRRAKQADAFVDALNGIGPRAEAARREL